MTLGELIAIATKEGATMDTKLTVKVNNKYIVPVTEIVPVYTSDTPSDQSPDSLQIGTNFKANVL